MRVPQLHRLVTATRQTVLAISYSAIGVCVCECVCGGWAFIGNIQLGTIAFEDSTVQPHCSDGALVTRELKRDLGRKAI